MTGFAGVDVRYDSGLACMDAVDDPASNAVAEFAGWFSFHRIVPVASALYPVSRTLSSRKASEAKRPNELKRSRAERTTIDFA
jgi:hypothetical protein